MLAIITSVISCVRYLNIIQLSNFYFNPITFGDHTKILHNSSITYVIAIITVF